MHLLVFCLKYPPIVSLTHYIDLEFPVQENINSTYVFLGEVTFLNGGSEPCDPTIPRQGKNIYTVIQVVGHCLAIGKLPVTRWVWVIIG